MLSLIHYICIQYKSIFEFAPTGIAYTSIDGDILDANNSLCEIMGYPKEEMSGHGFRAMARTILDEVLQIRPDFIEHQLAHAVRDPNGRAYNRTAHLNERRKMMQKWADYLDDIKQGAKVLPFRKITK